jgi:hypothetical protein
MASAKQWVSLTGVLRGNGQEATCDVQALEVRLGGTGVTAYAQFKVGRTSKPLPYGEYEITVAGQTQRIRHMDGHWLAPMI